MPLSSPTTGFPLPARRAIHDHWRLFLAEGGFLILLGALAVVLPFIAGLATAVFVGWLLLIAGFGGLVATFRSRTAPGFIWSLLSGLIALVAGVLLLLNPLQGLLTLTLVLTAYFFVDGIFNIVLAVAHRRELSGRWEWMMLNRVVDIVLAAIIFGGLPGTSTWALGLLVGIDLLFGGASLTAMSLDARKDALQ